MNGLLYLVAGMLFMQGLFWLYIASLSGAPLDWGAGGLLLLGSTLILPPVRRALGRAMGAELDANMTLRFMVVLFLAGSLFFYFSSKNFTTETPTQNAAPIDSAQARPRGRTAPAEMRDATRADSTRRDSTVR